MDVGSGNSLITNTGLAILSTSKHQQGAWEFLRLLLMEEWQKNNANTGFPTNKNVFNERLTSAIDRPKWSHIPYGDIVIELRPLTEEQASELITVINTATGIISHLDPLQNIIFESLGAFYQGQITAQDAARIIQNRASNFVAERR